MDNIRKEKSSTIQKYPNLKTFNHQQNHNISCLAVFAAYVFTSGRLNRTNSVTELKEL